MKRVHRVLVTAAATVLLGVGGVALAAPAQAEADVNLLGGVATVGMNGVVEVRVLGATLVNLNNPLNGVV
ncbi:hypothetical protein [Streptomyces sp. I05A-00742]|uniref:hypothetical protein n=1 Tax=Streptomyces sp. I05A-00742 TaxID=2732853 RepID=UPI00148997AE|nr:hypothetical protein [Streptomyces sp. I05A-00742]